MSGTDPSDWGDGRPHLDEGLCALRLCLRANVRFRPPRAARFHWTLHMGRHLSSCLHQKLGHR